MNMSAYNEFMALALQRYSCRKYKNTPVNKEIILQLIEAARIAPSACNKQPWTFYIADDKESTEKIVGCYEREWVKNVPAFIVAVGNHDESWHRSFDNKDHADIDIAIACEHICLAAAALGLGSCWICHFDAKKCAEVLGLSQNQEPIAIIPIGFPENNDIPNKNRKSIDEITKWCDR